LPNPDRTSRKIAKRASQSEHGDAIKYSISILNLTNVSATTFTLNDTPDPNTATQL